MNKIIEISVNQEDVQNIIDCYEKDIKYIKQLEAKVNQLETNRDEAIELLKEHLNSTNYEFEEYEWFSREYLEEVLSKLERGKEY